MGRDEMRLGATEATRGQTHMGRGANVPRCGPGEAGTGWLGCEVRVGYTVLCTLRSDV